jgi:hypothetical protein
MIALRIYTAADHLAMVFLSGAGAAEPIGVFQLARRERLL